MVSGDRWVATTQRRAVGPGKVTVALTALAAPACQGYEAALGVTRALQPTSA